MMSFGGTCSVNQNVSVYNVCVIWISNFFFNMKKAEYFDNLKENETHNFTWWYVKRTSKSIFCSNAGLDTSGGPVARGH